MLEMVEARRNADKGEQCHDLFSGLLDAAQDELDSEATLSDEELIGVHPILRSESLESGLLIPSGNMFIFLFAGHEVRSSHSSCGVAPKQFPTDHSVYIMLLICLIGTVSRRTRASVSTH